MASPPVEYDAQGKPIPASNSPAPEYDASGKPLPGQTGGGHDPALDNAPQGNPGFFGPIQDAYDSVIARPPQGDLDKVGPIGRGFANIGRHVLQAASPIMHPNQTGQALFKQFQPGATFKDTPLYQMGSSIVGDYKAHGPVEGTEDLAGDALGGYLGGKLAEAPLKAGAPMERIGYGAVNDALGARGPKPFQYGHNPARGALEEGVVPAISKQESSIRVQPAMDRVGGQIGSAIGSSPNSILLKDIAASVNSPLRAASAVAEGPGVGGVTSDQIGKVGESMTRSAPGASRPIYGAGAGTPFSPSELVQKLRTPQMALPAPTEDIPLSEPHSVAGRPSQPKILTSNRAVQREFPPYGADTSTRLEPGGSYVPPESEFRSPETYGGMGPNEYIGGRPGQRGGISPPSGVLRRPAGIAQGEPVPFQYPTHPTATPNDVWRTIQNIDEKTRYNKLTPEVEGMNELQQGIRHGLRGNLEEAVPQIKGPSQTYGDLAGARDAIERTIHSGQSLSKIMDLIKYPAETYGGAGLVKGGRLLQSIDPRFLRTIGRAPAVAAPLLKQGGQ